MWFVRFDRDADAMFSEESFKERFPGRLSFFGLVPLRWLLETQVASVFGSVALIGDSAAFSFVFGTFSHGDRIVLIVVDRRTLTRWNP